MIDSSLNPVKSGVPAVDLGERFEIIEVLGHGSFGAVYKVMDRETGEIVALKVLVNGTAGDAQAERRFKEEMAICRSLTHRNLVRAYDAVMVSVAGKRTGKMRLAPAFTMEFVEGSNLLDLLGQDRFSSGEIDRIMYQLLEGLNVLHLKKIVHRDIKLENIMLRTDGIVKLTDLGLVKRLEYDLGLTGPSTVLGTPIYMSPEYIKYGKVDERSDIYACGVILYEILAGHRRYTQERDGVAILAELQGNSFQFPQIELKGAKKKYLKILARALAVEPRNRYQSVTEMQADLLPQQSDHPENLHMHSSVYFGVKSRSFYKKIRRSLFVAALALVAFVAGMVVVRI